MFKLSLLFLLIGFTQTLQAQNDTTYLYFDKAWKPAPKEQAVFYGKVVKQGNTWHRQDFWVKGNIMQMDAYYSDADTKTMQGPVKYYTEAGLLDDSSNFDNNTEKSAYYFYPNHSLKAYAAFAADGSITEQKGYDDKGQEIPGYVVQKVATFPGGVTAWQNYLVSGLQKNLPKSYRKGEISGVVTVTFLVYKDGTVQEVTAAISSGYPELDEHAVKIISNSPKWIPAIQFGNNVIYRQKQQITYPKVE